MSRTATATSFVESTHVCLYGDGLPHAKMRSMNGPAAKKYGCWFFQDESCVLIAKTAQRQKPRDTMYAT